MLRQFVLKALAIWRTRQSLRIPYTALQAKHVKNLKTIVDRSELLSYLPKQGIVAEVGVSKGDYSQLIWEKTQPAQLHLIDMWEGKVGRQELEEVKRRFSAEIRNERVVLHQGRSTTMLKQFKLNTFDWVYLDTDHTYQTTTRELDLLANVTKKNGLILGHDYVTGNWNGGIRYGVVEAVNEFCVQNNWAFSYLTAETHRHLSYGIKLLTVDR